MIVNLHIQDLFSYVQKEHNIQTEITQSEKVKYKADNNYTQNKSLKSQTKRKRLGKSSSSPEIQTQARTLENKYNFV